MQRPLLGLVAMIFMALGSFVPGTLGQSVPLRWRWSNPLPHGGNVYDMIYHQGLTLQVAERGLLYSTEDLDYWWLVPMYTTNALRAVTFLDQRLVITGEGGKTWYGDSLDALTEVQLPTSDWLEGVASSGSVAIAVGDNGSVYATTNGVSWTRETVPSFTNGLRGITWAQNLFVAVGERGLIATRPNNGGWSVEASGTTRHLNRAAFIGNQFWVVGDAGACLVGNAAGKGWKATTGLSITNPLYTVSGTNNTVLVAGEKAAWLTTDGSTWSNQITASTNYPAPSWTYYCSVWEGSLFVLAGRSGMTVQGFQTNAASPWFWVPQTYSVRNWLWDVLRLPDFYVAVGDRATIMTSTDGVHWDLELTPMPTTNTVLLGVGGDTNRLVVVGNRGCILVSTNGQVEVLATNFHQGASSVATNWASTLGLAWSALTPPTTNDLEGIAAKDDFYVACGGGGVIFTSTNASDWIRRTSPVTAFLSSACATPWGWVLSGDRGVILTSTNGVNWTQRASGTTNWISRVRYLQDLLVAVGENGVILTSTNGTHWSLRSSGITKWLNDLDYLKDRFWAVGNQGAVLTSSNATEWAYVGTLTGKSLYGLAGRANQIITAGLEGVILRAPTQPILDPVSILRYARTSNESILLLAGQVDQMFALEHSTNLVEWSNSLTLEIQDRSGTLLIVPPPNSNPPPASFLRARILP